MDKYWIFEKILDYVEEYCESTEDFQYVIANIERMQENFEEGDE